MTTISIRIPESVSKHVEKLAAAEGMTPDEFYASAAVEKLAAWETAAIAARAARADEGAFARAMAKIPAREPEMESDRLPDL